jgi:hypothetical protein
MNTDKRKITAAVAGVMAYIRTEEEAICAAKMAAALPAAEPAAPPVKLWGISGRQSQMQLRNLMQMKAFHGIRK